MKSAGVSCDIAVIGAGPAGSTAAYILASRGKHVILLDKRQFPRPKLCAGLLTRKTIRVLESIYGYDAGDLLAQGIISHRTNHYRIYRGSTMIAHNRLDYPFQMVKRTTYDHHWLQAAIHAGACAITGQAVRMIDPPTGMIHLANRQQIRAHVIIGADGAWSIARRSIYKKQNAAIQWRSQLAMAIETRCPHAIGNPSRDFVALHFGFIPWGYAWDFPGRTHRILGICGIPHKSDRPLSEVFRAFLTSVGLDSRELEPHRAHPLPFGNFVDPPARQRVLLVGDACGLADPLLGEGIYYAHRSAQIAAGSVLACAPSYRGLERHYRDGLNREILAELRWIKALRNLLYTGGRRRRYRGLRLMLQVMPGRIEAAIHGRLPFSRLLWPFRYTSDAA